MSKEQNDRCLSTVLRTALLFIPETESKLRGRLHAVHSSVLYTPPEMMHTRWKEASTILAEEIGGGSMTEPTQLTGWKKIVFHIWSMTPY